MAILSIFLSSYVLAVANTDIRQGRPKRVADLLEVPGANLNTFPVFHVYFFVGGPKSVAKLDGEAWRDCPP